MVKRVSMIIMPAPVLGLANDTRCGAGLTECLSVVLTLLPITLPPLRRYSFSQLFQRQFVRQRIYAGDEVKKVTAVGIVTGLESQPLISHCARVCRTLPAVAFAGSLSRRGAVDPATRLWPDVQQNVATRAGNVSIFRSTARSSLL